jgi:hypothetical protein
VGFGHNSLAAKSGLVVGRTDGFNYILKENETERRAYLSVTWLQGLFGKKLHCRHRRLVLGPVLLGFLNEILCGKEMGGFGNAPNPPT